MEIRHLRYFKVLAEELHFGKAAKRLFISQPPLSRQIKELEEELSVKLLTRDNKRVALTEAGKHYLRECEYLLNGLEKAKQQCQQIHLAESGIFNLGYISSISKEKLSELLKQIKNSYPLLQVHLFETSSQKQLTALEQGKLDIGIVRAPITRPMFTQKSLYEDGFVLALSSSRGQIMNGDLRNLNLSRSSFISYNSDYAPVYHQKFIEICSRLNFTPIVMHECNTIQSILELVAHDVGIAIVPKTVQQSSIASNICFLDISDSSDIKTQIVMTYLSNNPNKLLFAISELISDLFK
ncbi:LysR family transcriptional regulator [Sphingobacterium yanglingense]|uniref:LysR family transcriptional regulator n=1 Tax=Sphingobacterium yanglingense TaxID=1437280 RepID=A0A4R6WI61_9SPHI|nr:LysR substrate-binding domain-containing protein [Sphingobacterium yanglingense]TDQ77246.1 LysR family transcriptional regulator [Sphingobacterium yanglingense]